MKTKRQTKILELIQKHDIETQEELSAYLTREGFQVTQATVSRDIRELKLTKIAMDNGRQRYAVLSDADTGMAERLVRVLREGFVSMDYAGNILVIKTVSGMASAVGAAVDAIKLSEIIGSIAGDDTLMCVIRTEEDAVNIMNKLRKLVEK
ncbi:MAG: arginine repressor [Lachnospiraceae bacterium]|nr:arginine repressor [Lachnospiraceae bacterium]MDY5521815.1 arginine repressor [Agathobacter sp.]